ncbi:glycosyltransferase, partial [Escherichia coli]|uniref:glycosyltransferase n=1 Tax=Escherichia coli TaxID=562 RepID=UPI00398AE6FC
DTTAVRNLPNVHFTGRRPYQSLPGYCKKFDIAVLPFVVNELTLAANPLKLREYLAAGLPVVATPLPEVQKLGDLIR